jgi:hypothetical protein
MFPLDVLVVILPPPKEDLFDFPITPPLDDPDLFLGIVSSYADTQDVPFQSYTVGVSAVSSVFVASQPLELSALYFVSFHTIKYLQTFGDCPSSVIVGYVIGACQSSLSSNDHDA